MGKTCKIKCFVVVTRHVQRFKVKTNVKEEILNLIEKNNSKKNVKTIAYGTVS